MGLIELVLLLVIVGVVVGWIQKVPNIDPTFAQFIRVVVIIAVALWLWHLFGAPDIPIGRR